jgi:branched-chain amino acid transport system ATP-binding protein
MSGGEQKMLSVARSLMGNPYLIMLDEPSEGVAPIIVEQMAELIKNLKQQGLTILLSEQNMFFAQELANSAILLDKGQIRFKGSLADLEQHLQLKTSN